MHDHPDDEQDDLFVIEDKAPTPKQAGLFDGELEPIKEPTRLERRIVAASTDIITQPDELIPEFLHAVLCQVSLPRKATDARHFERSSGKVHIRIEAGSQFNGMQWVDQPLPYGARPRLVLVHLCTEAVRTGQAEIDVGRSVREFLLRLGIESTGGTKGTYTMFRKQMQALAACTLRMSYPVGDKIANLQAPPIEEFQAWIKTDNEGQAVLWPGVMKLSPRFFDSLREHAVPLDGRALAALKHSALALDLYAWLGHRLCRVRKSDGIRVSWASLKDQFGEEYRNPKDFKKEVRSTLRQVIAVYPSARLDEVSGGLVLYPSPPPIPKTQVLVQLPQKGTSGT